MAIPRLDLLLLPLLLLLLLLLLYMNFLILALLAGAQIDSNSDDKFSLTFDSHTKAECKFSCRRRESNSGHANALSGQQVSRVLTSQRRRLNLIIVVVVVVVYLLTFEPLNFTHTHRLIIDRSILLLLSTSKCCLRLEASRGHSDCLRSLEARRQSILVQIRASISVILAIVKCSVFSSSEPASPHVVSASSSSSSSAFSCRPAGAYASSSPDADQWLRAADLHETLWQSGGSGSSSTNHNNVFASLRGASAGAPSQPRQLDDELEQQDYYLRYLAAVACQSPSPPLPLPRPQLGGGGQLNSRRLTPRQTGAAAKLNPNQQQPTNNNSSGPDKPQMDGAAARQPLQIMHYFLRTWSGTPSAHDAINNLQVSPPLNNRRPPSMVVASLCRWF